MANLIIEMPIRVFDRKAAEEICTFFSGVNVTWLFCQKETPFAAEATFKETLGNRYRHEIIGIKKLIKLFPDNLKLREDLVQYEEKAKEDKIYDVTVTFEGEIAAEIDIDHNSILHYTGPINTNLTHRDMNRLKKLVESDPLDEFYEDYIKKFITCIIMASVFAAPSIHLGFRVFTWIDGNKYKSGSFVEEPLHEEAFSRYAELMTTSLKYEQAFSWIKKYTKMEDDSPKPPVPFTMLTYLFNRDSHESLLYSVIGLENLYSAKSKNISELLHKRIAYIFPQISKEQIEGMYARRSDFVHGKIRMPIYKDYADLRNGDFYFDDAATLACALLLETMRKMIANDASKILFDVYCSYRFVYRFE